MKKKTIILALLFILVIGSVYSINKQYGNTLDARQRILSKRDNHVIIISEIIIENSIISEIMDQEAGYGHGQFEKNEKGNYIFKTKKVRTEQYEPIVTDIIQINDEFYEVLMCNKSGLDYAEVIYTDDSTGKKDDTIRVEMHNQTVAILEAPEYSSYTRHVVFYNYNGDKFEWY